MHATLYPVYLYYCSALPAGEQTKLPYKDLTSTEHSRRRFLVFGCFYHVPFPPSNFSLIRTKPTIASPSADYRSGLYGIAQV